jgi:hypothetical protein
MFPSWIKVDGVRWLVVICVRTPSCVAECVHFFGCACVCLCARIYDCLCFVLHFACFGLSLASLRIVTSYSTCGDLHA